MVYKLYIKEQKNILQTLTTHNNIQVRVPLQKFSLSKKSKKRFLIIDDGSERVGQPPSLARKYSKRGLTLIEGLWLITFYPEILKHHSIDLVESFYSKECVPTIYLWQNKVNLSAICPDVSDSMCGAPFVVEEYFL